MSNSLPRKPSVVISERSSKPDDLAFMELEHVYGNKDDEIFENPMNRSVPVKYLNYENKNTKRNPYYNEKRPSNLGGKTRRRSKYRKTRKGGKYRKTRKGGKSKNKKTRKH